MPHLLGKLAGLAAGLTYVVFCKYHASASSADEDTLGLQFQSLQASDDTNALRLLFRYDSAAQELDIQISPAGGGATHTAAAPNVDDGGWHVLAARWTGTNVAVWFDGFQIGGTTAFTGPLRSASTAKYPEIMGGHNVTGISKTDSPRFDLKSWGLWSRALTPAEMYSLYDPQTRWALYIPPGPYRIRAPAAAAAVSMVFPPPVRRVQHMVIR